MRFSKLSFLKLALAGLMLSFSALSLAQNGLFWKATAPSGKITYLFGTMHTDDNRVTNFSPAVKDALKSSDSFMMETLAPNDPSVFMTEHGSLEGFLNKKELDTLLQLAEFHVMHSDAALNMKPWLLAVVFDSPRPLTPFGQDNLLMSQAEDLGKEVIGIEDTQEHFGVMDNFSHEEQLMMLRAVLKRTQQTKQNDFDKILNAYLQGNADKISQLDDKITGAMLPANLWARMRVKLIDERNSVMAERVIEEGVAKNIFVAVGASHLAGPGGLVAKLKQAKYQLQAIK